MKGSGEENEEQAPDYCLGWYIDVVIGSDFNPMAGAQLHDRYDTSAEIDWVAVVIATDCPVAEVEILHGGS